ncbi:MAG: ParB-like protein [Bdellovibrionota bacterium]
MKTFLYIFAFLAWTTAAQADPCDPEMQAKEKCRLELSKLKPTQGAVGRREVERLKVELTEMAKDPEELKEYLKGKRIEVIIGPGGKYHIIDGHHHAVALSELGIGPGYIEIVDNLSDKSTEEFWSIMKEKHWVRLRNGNGEAISIAQLPKHLKHMKDDPYRSLAGTMADVKAFKSEPTPFMEFSWADYLRERIPLSLLKSDWDGAVVMATRFALDPEADKLPGFRDLPMHKGKKRFRKCMEKYRELAP